MLTTQHSMENSLRWIRRLIVIVLIIANLLTVMMADAASAAGNPQRSFPETLKQPGFNVHAVPGTGWEEKSVTLIGTSSLGDQLGFSGEITGETFNLAGIDDTAVSVPAVKPESARHN